MNLKSEITLNLCSNMFNVLKINTTELNKKGFLNLVCWMTFSRLIHFGSSVFACSALYLIIFRSALFCVG